MEPRPRRPQPPRRRALAAPQPDDGSGATRARDDVFCVRGELSRKPFLPSFFPSFFPAARRALSSEPDGSLGSEPDEPFLSPPFHSIASAARSHSGPRGEFSPLAEAAARRWSILCAFCFLSSSLRSAASERRSRMPARRRLLRSSSPWGEAISSSSLAAGEPDATASLASSSISSRGCLTGVVGQVTGGSDRREPYRSHEFCRSMGRARDEPGDLGCISGFRYGAIVGRCQLPCRVMRASLAATASCSRAFCAAIAAAQRRCHCSTKRVASAYAASAKPTSTMAYTASTLSGM